MPSAQPSCLTLGLLHVLGWLHGAYLSVVNCAHSCNPPRPAADLV